MPVAKSLAHDCHNVLYLSLPKSPFSTLQCVLNALAQPVAKATYRYCSNISDFMPNTHFQLLTALNSNKQFFLLQYFMVSRLLASLNYSDHFSTAHFLLYSIDHLGQAALVTGRFGQKTIGYKTFLSEIIATKHCENNV